MKAVSLLLVVLLLCSGCTSVPKVNNPREVEKGVFIVKINKEFEMDTHTYAINEFVKSRGYDSYDKEQVKTPGFLSPYYEYSVTVPGSIAVEDFKQKKVIDKGKSETVATGIGYILGIILTPIIIIGGFAWFIGK